MRALKLPYRGHGKNLKMHELRHTYASRQLRADGTNIYDLMRQMGHSNITTAMGYQHDQRRLAPAGPPA